MPFEVGATAEVKKSERSPARAANALSAAESVVVAGGESSCAVAAVGKKRKRPIKKRPLNFTYP